MGKTGKILVLEQHTCKSLVLDSTKLKLGGAQKHPTKKRTRKTTLQNILTM